MKFFISVYSIFILFTIGNCCSTGQSFQLRETLPDITSEPIEKGLAPIRDIQMYYEIHGKKMVFHLFY